MSITPAELSAVRNALSNDDVTPLVVAKTYPPKTALLLALTIIAANKATFEQREFGPLIRKLVVEIAEPDGGWPGNENGPIKPEWYTQKHRYNFTERSRRNGLHTSGDRAGNNIRLTLPDELLELLKEPLRKRKAQTWYKVALEKSEQKKQQTQQRTARKQAIAARRKAMQDELRENDVYWKALVTGDVTEQQAYLILGYLGAILSRHFPPANR